MPELFKFSLLFKTKKSTVLKIELTCKADKNSFSSFKEQSKNFGIIFGYFSKISSVIFSVSNSIIGEFPYKK